MSRASEATTGPQGRAGARAGRATSAARGGARLPGLLVSGIIWEVLRVLVIVGLSLTTAQAMGVSLMLGAHGCQERCADDNDDGECAPGCHDCTCCQGVRLTTPGEQVASGPVTPGRTLHPPITIRLSSAEPREILHVPKPLAA